MGEAATPGRSPGDTAPSLRAAVDALIDQRQVPENAVHGEDDTALAREVAALARLARPAAVTSELPGRRRLTAWAQAWMHGSVAAWMSRSRNGWSHVACLAAGLQASRTPREVAARVAEHTPALAGVSLRGLLRPAGPVWLDVTDRCRPLRADGGVAALLASGDEVLAVDASQSLFRALPADDRHWLVEHGVGMLVGLPSRTGPALGGLMLSALPTGRLAGRRDRIRLAAIAPLVAMALGSLPERPTRTESRRDDEDVAVECDGCGLVTPVQPSCRCAAPRRLAALPMILHEAFRLERRLGRGGMGVVYLARDVRLDRPVALKTLPAIAADHVEALRSEARAMASLDHPSVAALYGLETWRDTPVLVTEYLPGGILADRLASGALPVDEAVTCAIHVAEALSAVHARGWTHGDLKPGNIGFTAYGTPKLLDFGLSRCAPVEALGPGQRDEDEFDHAVAGTPLYLSPEARAGRPHPEADDVWALAAVVAEAIGGVHPYGERRDVAVRRLRRGVPPDLTRVQAVAPALAPSLAGVLQAAGSGRMTSATAFADVLRGARGASSAR